MIFLTVGTHEPFDRLVRSVDDWCAHTGASVFGQIAESEDGYVPTSFEWVARMTPDEYQRRLGACQLLISHAGMGSVITAMSAGKPIVVLPRRGHLRETRNDHQFATARQLAGRPGITVVMTEQELPAVLDEILAHPMENDERPALSPFADSNLIEAVRTFIQDHGSTD